MGVSRAGNSVKILRNLPISNPKPDLHNNNAHTKFGENPLMFTQVIIGKRKMDGHKYDVRTDRHTDGQPETLIPRHYFVQGYKKYPSYDLLEKYENNCQCKFKCKLKTFVRLSLY